jgi:hypothetical protein
MEEGGEEKAEEEGLCSMHGCHSVTRGVCLYDKPGSGFTHLKIAAHYNY